MHSTVKNLPCHDRCHDNVVVCVVVCCNQAEFVILQGCVECRAELVRPLNLRNIFCTFSNAIKSIRPIYWAVLLNVIVFSTKITFGPFIPNVALA